MRARHATRGTRMLARRRPTALAALAAIAIVLMRAAPLTAQRAIPAGAVRPADSARSSPAPSDLAALTRFTPVVDRGVGRRANGTAPWWAPVASAIVPGTGQAVLGQDRWVGFVAVESYAWLRYLSDRRDGGRERRNYRRIANQVARALYVTGRPLAGDFDYYETMEKWVESGVYDALPGGELDPEPDTSTYNGATWLLARQTYWADPDAPPLPESMAYQNAMAFYERRAIRPEFRWSWRDAQLQQDLYRRAIARSNAGYQRAAQDLAAVLANHVLSTVDAYVTVRLRRRPGALGEETRIEATLPWPGVERGLPPRATGAHR